MFAIWALLLENCYIIKITKSNTSIIPLLLSLSFRDLIHTLLHHSSYSQLSSAATPVLLVMPLICWWCWYFLFLLTGFWVTDSLRTKCEEEEEGRRRQKRRRRERKRKQERVGGRETIKRRGKDSPHLHEGSYGSYIRSRPQVIVVGSFIFLQDLF